MDLKKGDVFYARIPQLENSRIQAGVRPIVIMANQKALDNSPVIQYIPLTTQIKKMCLPVHVEIETDFLRPSIALVEQVGCIDKHRLLEKIGTLSEKYIWEIDTAILIQHGMDEMYFMRKRMKQHAIA